MHYIAIAESEAGIDRCFLVMLKLRPHLISAEFIQRVNSLYQPSLSAQTLACDRP